MIEVEMGKHDVPDVGGVEAEAADLCNRGSSSRSWMLLTARKNSDSRRGCATSRVPKPVSTRMSPALLSISRQWQTMRPSAASVVPSNTRPPTGQHVPQFRWWMRISQVPAGAAAWAAVAPGSAHRSQVVLPGSIASSQALSCRVRLILSRQGVVLPCQSVGGGGAAVESVPLMVPSSCSAIARRQPPHFRSVAAYLNI